MNSPLLALDIGRKRTGVAISESGILSTPLTVLQADPPHMQRVVQEVVTLVREHETKTLVIGIPYSSEDALTEQAVRIEQVINRLEEQVMADVPWPVAIERINEFRTSQDAAELYPGVPGDSAAAALILQDYIDQYPA